MNSREHQHNDKLVSTAKETCGVFVRIVMSGDNENHAHQTHPVRFKSHCLLAQHASHATNACADQRNGKRLQNDR